MKYDRADGISNKKLKIAHWKCCGSAKRWHFGWVTLVVIRAAIGRKEFDQIPSISRSIPGSSTRTIDAWNGDKRRIYGLEKLQDRRHAVADQMRYVVELSQINVTCPQGCAG
jgi:hypothetical protein